nr:hypothetical protein Iba_chr10cCG9910 [Ipomoea batatas]
MRVCETSRPDWFRRKPLWKPFQTGRRNQSARLVSPKTTLETIPDWSAKSVGQTGFTENQFGLVSRLVGETSRPDWFHFTETSLDWFPGRFRKSDGSDSQEIPVNDS